MDKHMVFQLNKFADEYDEIAKAYRVVANDLMKLQPKENRSHHVKKEVNHRGVEKGHKYKPGTHWMQQPKNRDRVLKTIRKMHRAKKASR